MTEVLQSEGGETMSRTTFRRCSSIPSADILVSPEGSIRFTTVNLRLSYWFNSRTDSPAKANSALLRLTKNALLDAGIELPIQSAKWCSLKEYPASI
nr:BON domain-containing protein [Rhizobium sp. TCK]